MSRGTCVPKEQKPGPSAPVRPFKDHVTTGLCCTAHAKGDSQTAESNFRGRPGSVNLRLSLNPTVLARIFAENQARLLLAVKNN